MSDNIRPILYDNKQAARACGVSLSLWKVLVSTGRTPEPIRLNSKILFDFRQLQAWSWAGCPSRDSQAWQEILKKQRGEI